ncbi:unnamed protein product [Lactuca virosa]|uniref:TRF2/HOY1 PH-like domain-containing protein n=1 Tax=Lactuca virosa TaxID=75947 RepID=A0AAU9MJH7_9ASTR|nr:unnamed protein product [Lactuca virosa]
MLVYPGIQEMHIILASPYVNKVSQIQKILPICILSDFSELFGYNNTASCAPRFRRIPYLMWPEKKRTNAWQWQEQETTDLAGEKRPMELKKIEEPLPKRMKSSSDDTTNEWLSEFKPMGLKLHKSPSFLELIEKELNEVNKNDDSLPSENLQVGNKKDVKTKVGTSDSIDKLKASNFPALRLKIGNWEYVSQHEGDLVAKCYFAKHKLVWEVLDGGLKNKIEIQWEDILSLKANFPENGPGTLTVLPLFFRETNPLPRKHTIWQATSDFTGGEASRSSKKHYLQCAQGVLNKHYEKLIHCDTRLNFLSQQFDTVLDKPFQEAFIEAPNISHDIVSNRLEIFKVPSVVDINGIVLQPTSQCQLLGDANFAQEDVWKNNINGWQDRIYYSSHEGMISLSTSECLLQDANTTQKDTMEDHVYGWQKNTMEDQVNGWQKATMDDLVYGWQDGNNHSNLICNIPSNNYWMKQGWEEEFGNVSGYKQDFGMSRKGSFTDLLLSLPPGFSFDVFDDDKIL